MQPLRRSYLYCDFSSHLLCSIPFYRFRTYRILYVHVCLVWNTLIPNSISALTVLFFMLSGKKSSPRYGFIFKQILQLRLNIKSVKGRWLWNPVVSYDEPAWYQSTIQNYKWLIQHWRYIEWLVLSFVNFLEKNQLLCSFLFYLWTNFGGELFWMKIN